MYYSMYGHIRNMADKIREGVEAAGCEGILYQFAETLPENVLGKMNAAPKDETVTLCANSICS